MATMPPLTEDQLKEKTIALATVRGWLVHHDRPARTEKGWRTPVEGHPGYPDLTLARNGTIIFAELKSETGHVAVAQRAWLHELAGMDPAPGGPLVVVWRPEDWPQIEAILR